MGAFSVNFENTENLKNFKYILKIFFAIIFATNKKFVDINLNTHNVNTSAKRDYFVAAEACHQKQNVRIIPSPVHRRLCCRKISMGNK